jgi:hypothetical protein
MQARVVAAGQGARWLLEGWRLVRAAPFVWILLVFVYFWVTQFLLVVPLVGGALAAISVPGITLGFMALARAASSGVVDPRLMFDGFRHDARRQLLLGVVYLACGLVVFGAMQLADVNDSLRAALSAERGAERPPAADLAMPIAAFVAGSTPVMMMFWFAPALCAWHSIGVFKALFFSFFGFLFNWRAFLVYGAVVAAAILALSILAVAVVPALGVASRGSGSVVIALLVMALLVVLSPLFASFYASYRDVFGYHSPE